MNIHKILSVGVSICVAAPALAQPNVFVMVDMVQAGGPSAIQSSVAYSRNQGASIPIGTAGTDIAFDNATRALIFASGQFKVGSQVIEGTAPATLMG